MKSGSVVGVNHVHLAVAGRDDEVLAGRHQRVGVAEKINREPGENRPQPKSEPTSNIQHEFADDLAQQRGGQQRDDCGGGQADEVERGLSRLFPSVSRGQHKIFARDLQFGIFGAVWFPSPKSGAVAGAATETKPNTERYYVTAHT